MAEDDKEKYDKEKGDQEKGDQEKGDKEKHDGSLYKTRVIGSIKLADVEKGVDPTEDVQMQNIAQVASYSWVAADSPTILVPGQPAAWTPPAETQQLKADNEPVSLDPNGINFPNHPLQPAIEAVVATDPEFDLAGLDLVACNATLKALLQFVMFGPRHDVSMDVEVIGTTVFFVRSHLDRHRTTSPGYRQDFLGKYTTLADGLEEASVHYKITAYTLGGIKILMPYKADACLPETADAAATAETMTLFPEKQEDGLTVRSKGHTFENQPLCEINMRGGDTVFAAFLRKKLPALWMTKVPNVVIAYHADGLVVPAQIRHVDITPDVQKWEASSQKKLRLFTALLREILAKLDKKSGRYRIYTHNKKESTLRISELGLSSGRHALCKNWKWRWLGFGATIPDP